MQTSIYKDSPLISVIIPVYNVEKYLVRCIQSVLTQTYENYEIILVDDGSTDSSGRMCDDFARLNDRVRTFHKTNGGLSDARNFGVTKSKGEYVVFVDSDDYVSDEYIDYLVRLREMFDADVAVTKLASYKNNDFSFCRDAGKMHCMTTEDALIKMMYRVDFSVSAVGKIYPKALLEAHPYPVGIFYEDLATTYKIIADCKRVAYGDKVVYCYRARDGSITRQNITKMHLHGIAIAVEELRYMEQHFPSAIDAAKYSVAHMIIGLVDNVLRGGVNNRDYFYFLQKNLKVYFFSILYNSNLKISRKIRCVAIILGYYPTKILWKSIDILHKGMKISQI